MKFSLLIRFFVENQRILYFYLTSRADDLEHLY